MKKVHLIGNAHIDPVWLWRKTEGLSEILATFRSALDRMHEFPGYIFSSACAAYYDWVEKVDPAMFVEIQNRVKEGRWHITGGFWIQPDCNIPSGESFARHLLYSQRYFQSRFGRKALVGYNVDSFGHNGMLPQILKKAGMDYYVFMRPDAAEKPELPGDLFIWESPDGSRVTAFRITGGYNTRVAGQGFGDAGDGPDAAAIKAQAHLEKAGLDGYPNMCFYGVGNHGGGPTISNLAALSGLCADNPNIGFSSADAYFDGLRESGKLGGLPIVKGDLQHHASGCYSANSAVKAANRRAEQALCAAEKFDVLASALCAASDAGAGADAGDDDGVGVGASGSGDGSGSGSGSAYAGSSMHRSLQPAWEKLMFNQFHDILAGCSIRGAYNDALDELAAARAAAAEITDLALHRISWRIKTTDALDGKHAQKNGWALWEKEGEGAPVAVFNPHSFPVSAPVQISSAVCGIKDSVGRPLAPQIVRGPQTNGRDKYGTLFQAELPPLGYSTYFVYKNETFDAPPDAAAPYLSASEDCLENELIKVTFDPGSGYITGYYDKESAAELAGGPMAKPVLIDDEAPDTWSHGIFTFDKEIGAFGTARTRVLETGPVRAGLRVISRYGESALVQDFYIYPGKKEIEVRCRLDFHERLAILKMSFPANVGDPVAVYSMPFGHIVKEADGREEPSQEWMGVVSQKTGLGLALLNDCKYSFCAKHSDMRMIAARGCIYADHYGERDDLVEYQDQGEQFFGYIIMPHSQKDPSPTVRRAMLLNAPPAAIMETHHGKRAAAGNGDSTSNAAAVPVAASAPVAAAPRALPASYAGIRISNDRIVAQTIKFAENANGYILRLVETSGAGAGSEAEINFPPAKARFTTRLAPQEVKTYYIPFNGKNIKETYLTED